MHRIDGSSFFVLGIVMAKVDVTVSHMDLMIFISRTKEGMQGRDFRVFFILSRVRI